MTEKVAEILSKIEQIEYILDNIKDELAATSFKTPQAPPPKPTEWKLGESAKAKAQEILDAYPNMTKEKIEQLIEEERAKAAGLLTEEAAAYLVASNLGAAGTGQQIETKLKEDVERALGPDASLLTISDDGIAITPNDFLGDLWGNINMILIALDYQWYPAGKDSLWRYNPPTTLGEGDYPDIANVSWLTKINDESVPARDVDARAWAFVYKYDATAKRPTDEMRPEMAELVNTLHKLDGRPLLYKGFKFSLSRDGGTVFRNLA